MAGAPIVHQLGALAEAGAAFSKAQTGVVIATRGPWPDGWADLLLRGQELGDLAAFLEEFGLSLERFREISRCLRCGLIADDRIMRRTGWTCACR